MGARETVLEQVLGILTYLVQVPVLLWTWGQGIDGTGGLQYVNEIGTVTVLAS